MQTSLLFDAKMFHVPRAFRTRVEDAMAMLRRGASHTEIREVHGSVVLKEALDAQQANAEFVNETSDYVRLSNVGRRSACNRP